MVPLLCCAQRFTIQRMQADDARQLLVQARQQGARLLEELLDQQRQLEASGALSPQQRMEGRTALAQMVESARALLHNLDQALSDQTPADLLHQEQDDAAE
jgi:hypothetical protein